MIEFDLSASQFAALGIEIGDMLSTAKNNWIVHEIRRDGTFNDCVWITLRRVSE